MFTALRCCQPIASHSHPWVWQILAIVAHEVGHERLGHVRAATRAATSPIYTVSQPRMAFVLLQVRTGFVISLLHTFVVLCVMRCASPLHLGMAPS